MSLPHPASYPLPSGLHQPNNHCSPIDPAYYQYMNPPPSSSSAHYRSQAYPGQPGLQNQPHVGYSLDATPVNDQGFYQSQVYDNAVQPSGVPAQWSFQDNQQYSSYPSAQPTTEQWVTGQQSQPFDQSYESTRAYQPRPGSSGQNLLSLQDQVFYAEPDNISPLSDDANTLLYPTMAYFPSHSNGFDDDPYSSPSSRSADSPDGSYHQGSQSTSPFSPNGPNACSAPRSRRQDDLSAPVFYEHTNMGRDRKHPDRSTSQPMSASPMGQYGSPSHSHTPIHHHAYQQQRAPSPMGHLPYPEEVQRQLARSSYSHPSIDNDPRWTEYRPEARTYVHQPQPHRPPPANETQYNQRYTPGSIALPAPTRSPPLIEDTPKKPLSLACLFCRKRKIACGSPPPDREDRTCNQCARRSLKCVYPQASRRGMRPRNEGDDGDVFQINPVAMALNNQ